MPSPKVRCDHDQMNLIAQTFGAQADSVNKSLSSLKKNLQTLQGGDWVGQGANAFYAEMNSSILPTMTRLFQALSTAQKNTLEVSRILKEAEEAAAAVLKDQAATGGPTGSPGGATGTPGGGAGSPGGVTNPTGGSAPVSGSAGTPLLSWDRFKGTGDVWKQEWVKDGKTSPKLGFKYKLIDGSVLGGKTEGSTDIGGVGLRGNLTGDVVKGEAGISAGIGEKGASFGVYGDYRTLTGQATGVIGSKDFGVTGVAGGKVLAAEAQLGLIDNQFGAKIGGTLISAEGTVGLNVAGVNVGVKGEIGLKAEAGFSIGAKGVEVKLPFISFGISFGGAK